MEEKKQNFFENAFDFIINLLRNKWVRGTLVFFLFIVIVRTFLEQDKDIKSIKKRITIRTMNPVNAIKEQIKQNDEDKKKIEEEKIRGIIERRKIEDERIQKIENILSEFNDSNPDKTQKKIKAGDLIKVKMISIINGNKNSVKDPVQLVLSVSNVDTFSKPLIGKRIGDVVTVDSKNLNFGNIDFNKEIDKINNIPELKDPEFIKTLKSYNFKESVKNSKAIYKIKIIEYVKPNEAQMLNASKLLQNSIQAFPSQNNSTNTKIEQNE